MPGCLERCRWVLVALLSSVGGGAAQAAPFEDDDVGRRTSLVLQVPDPGSVETTIVERLQEAGGFVRGRATEPSGAIALDLEVEAKAYDAFVRPIRDLGQVLQEQAEIQDPVAAFARTNGRINVLKVAEQGLLEQLSYLAPDDALALDVARELARVREDLAREVARRTTLEHRIEYAGVRVRLEPPGVASLWSDTLEAWRLLRDSPAVALRRAAPWVLGLGLPVAGLVFAWILPVFWIRGRRNSRSRSDSTEATRC